MSTRDVFSEISRDLWFLPGRGWAHRIYGDISKPNDHAALTRFIYRYFYLGIPANVINYGSQNNTPVNIEDREDKPFTDKLQAAVPSSFYPSLHWRYKEKRDQSCIVVKDGICLSVQEHECVVDQGDIQNVTVKMLTSRRYASPGFFAAYSARGPADHSMPLDRLYVNVKPCAAPDMLAFILKWGEKQKFPLTIKVANNPSSFDRCDALVAYLPRASFRSKHREIFSEILRFQDDLKLGVPAFAKQVSSGLAWAEDPASDGFGNDGFGMHRCDIIARSLEKYRLAGQVDPFNLKDHLLTTWRASGLDVDQPHLSPKS